MLHNVRYHGAVCKPKHSQPIHKQEDEESRTSSPSFLALEDYLVWPLLTFLTPHFASVLISLLTFKQTYWMLWPLGTVSEVLQASTKKQLIS